MNSKIISRIAPTPSGFLHSGNVYNFLLTYLFTRTLDGILYLRIDDYDLPRYRREFVENIFFTLDMLGIKFDGGASGVDEFETKFSSKFRRKSYQNALVNLQHRAHCYVCSCSHSMRGSFEDGRYAQICLEKDLKFEKYKTAIRLHVADGTLVDVLQNLLNLQDKFVNLADDDPRKFTPNQSINLAQILGDFVVWKKDDTPSYNLASLVDDESLGVNLLIRGGDLLGCSAAQKYMADILGLGFGGANFIHHGLLMQGGKKLSKSSLAAPINLKDGAKIHYKFVADMLGLDPAKCDTLLNLLECFKDKFLPILE